MTGIVKALDALWVDHETLRRIICDTCTDSDTPKH